MHNKNWIERIRRVVRQTFVRLGSADGNTFSETILIRDGNYCGHRFEQGELHAIWFVEEDQIKFYGVDGRVITTIVPFGSRRVAA